MTRASSFRLLTSFFSPVFLFLRDDPLIISLFSCRVPASCPPRSLLVALLLSNDRAPLSNSRALTECRTFGNRPFVDYRFPPIFSPIVCARILRHAPLGFTSSFKNFSLNSRRGPIVRVTKGIQYCRVMFRSRLSYALRVLWTPYSKAQACTFDLRFAFRQVPLPRKNPVTPRSTQPRSDP